MGEFHAILLNEFAKSFAEKLSIKCLFIWLTVVTCCLPVAETVSDNFEEKKLQFFLSMP
jgi:hypothetical protein